MGIWTEAVESKAQIIHEQLSAARKVAEDNGGDPEHISAPYLELLRKLYEDEYVFAKLADSSDLIARFTGPAVSNRYPTVTTLTGVITEIRNQVRGIAKSIAGLTESPRLKWPGTLDPHLSGIAQGSLIIGVNIPEPSDVDVHGQTSFSGASEQIYESVRSAVQSLPIVARYVEKDRINEEIREVFPDPALRDTVMVAAAKLAPSGRRGIDTVAFSSPEETTREPTILTPKSRRILNQSLSSPVRGTSQGTYVGIVREIDLDAHRFEIRRVLGVGAIRCVYDARQQELVRKILDSEIEVSGKFELSENRTPRLVSVSSIEILRAAPEQLLVDLESEK